MTIPSPKNKQPVFFLLFHGHCEVSYTDNYYYCHNVTSRKNLINIQWNVFKLCTDPWKFDTAKIILLWYQNRNIKVMFNQLLHTNICCRICSLACINICTIFVGNFFKNYAKIAENLTKFGHSILEPPFSTNPPF